MILEAQTPFSTYCTIKDLIESDADNSVVWIDAYMNSSIFHRFLRSIGDNVSVTLVSCEPKTTAAKHERNQWNSFLDISRLYALERGASRYRLVVHKGLLHDRWLLLDDKRLYLLGASVKDAGQRHYCTLTRLDGSTENLKRIKEHIDSGTEFFGSNTPQHLD